MSDLQCPATLLLARHGDAQYAVDGVPSVDGGGLTDKGRAQVRHLVEQVRPRRIAEVYSSTMLRTIQSAELASSGLGVQHIVTAGLQEFSVADLAGVSSQDLRAHHVYDLRDRNPDGVDGWLTGDLPAAYPGAEDGQAVVRRFKEAIEQIADTHRGETVLVFTHGCVMSFAVPQLALNVRNDFALQGWLPNCVAAEVEVDADGWRIVSWPSSADPAIVERSV